MHFGGTGELRWIFSDCHVFHRTKQTDFLCRSLDWKKIPFIFLKPCSDDSGYVVLVSVLEGYI